MAVSPDKSAQYSDYAAVPRKFVKPVDWGAKTRTSFAKLTLTAAGQGDASMIRLPAGSIRILPRNSRLVAPQGAASSTLAVGLGAYVKPDGTAVAADPDALLTATSTASAAISVNLLGTAAGQIEAVEVESRDGVDVTITAAGGNTAASGDVILYIEYQQGN